MGDYFVNEELNQAQFFIGMFGAPSRKSQFDNYGGPMRAPALPAIGRAYVDKAGNSGTKVAGASHVFISRPKPGQFFGTSGCDPSIGVLVYSTASNWIAVFHFGTKQDAKATIRPYGWNASLPGLRAVICGGTDEKESRVLLDDVITGLTRAGIKIEGIVNWGNVYYGLNPGETTPKIYVDYAKTFDWKPAPK